MRGPHGLVFAGGKLWFTVEGAKAIGSYDPATKMIDWVLGTGQDRTHMIYVFPSLNQMITSNVSSATITIIEKSNGPARGQGDAPRPPPSAPGLQNSPRVAPPGAPMGPPLANWTETIIPVGNGAEAFDVSRDGKEIWAANAQDGTISIIDMASKRVVQTLAADVKGANRLKFLPNGKVVFVSTFSGPDLTILDATTRAELKHVKLGRGAAGILMQPDGLRVYVACTPDDYVAVIDLKSFAIVGTITAAKQPDGLAWAVRN